MLLLLFVICGITIYCGNIVFDIVKCTTMRKYLMMKYGSVCIILCFICMPLFDEYSIIVYLYSFFDSPSILCVWLAILLASQYISRDYMIAKYNRNMVFPYKYNQLPTCDNIATCCFDNLCYKWQNSHFFTISHFWSFVVLIWYGFIVYGNTFGLLHFDLYHANIWIHAIFTFVFAAIIFVIDKSFGIVILLSLVVFACSTNTDMSIFEIIICPYLWVFSIFFVVTKICICIYKFLMW